MTIVDNPDESFDVIIDGSLVATIEMNEHCSWSQLKGNLNEDDIDKIGCAIESKFL